MEAKLNYKDILTAEATIGWEEVLYIALATIVVGAVSSFLGLIIHG